MTMRPNRHTHLWTVHDTLGFALLLLTLAVLAWGQWGAPEMPITN